jgi:hypothetical protein
MSTGLCRWPSWASTAHGRATYGLHRQRSSTGSYWACQTKSSPLLIRRVSPISLSACTFKSGNFVPTPASRHVNPAYFVFKDLATASHVFLRQGPFRGALQAPYTGAHKVRPRNDKTNTDFAFRRVWGTTISVEGWYGERFCWQKSATGAECCPASQAPEGPNSFGLAYKEDQEDWRAAKAV